MKILVLDIENSANLGSFWGIWQQNIPMTMVDETWFMLSWSAKWIGDKKAMGEVIDPSDVVKRDDSKLCQGLWDLLDEADVVVAHNGDRFDIPKINTRFLLNGYGPPSPFQSIDTLKVARKNFSFISNRLDDLAGFLGMPGKIKTNWSLWKDSLNGDKKALDKMLRYNKQDVKILEDVYRALIPWIAMHPNHALGADSMVCTRCGSKHLQSRGVYRTNSAVYKRYWCKDCKGWSRSRISDPTQRPEIIGTR